MLKKTQQIRHTLLFVSSMTLFLFFSFLLFGQFTIICTRVSRTIQNHLLEFYFLCAGDAMTDAPHACRERGTSFFRASLQPASVIQRSSSNSRRAAFVFCCSTSTEQRSMRTQRNPDQQRHVQTTHYPRGEKRENKKTNMESKYSTKICCQTVE